MGKKRLHAVTGKIPKESTGLRGSIYVHVEHDDDMNIVSIEFPHKWKEQDSVLGTTLDALSEAVTNIIEGL